MATAVLSNQSTQAGLGLTYPEKLEDYLKNVKLYDGQASAASDEQDNLTNKGSKIVPEVSGPQGKVIPLTIVDDPADWTAESLKGKEDEYTWTLTDKDRADIIHATEKITTRYPESEESVKNLKAGDYDWPEFSAKLVEVVKNVSLGRGFHLVKGFPVEHFRGNRYGLVVAFWGLALVLGKPQISQTDYDREHKTFGSLLNHVSVGRFTAVRGADVYPGTKKSDFDDRVPNAGKGPQKALNERRLEFHSDQGATDLIALLSVNKAKSGGASKWVSAVAIHNELLRQGRKDLVEALSEEGAWKVPHKVDQVSYSRNKDGSFTGFEDDPPFIYHNGYLSSHFASGNYQEIELTPLQKEAVWKFAALAENPRFHLSKTLEPGEIEIISNQVILHARGDIENGQVPEENRQLLRWWVAQPEERNPRGIIPSFAPRSSVRPEGGFRFAGDEGGWEKLRLPFYPYSAHDGEGQSEW